MASSASIVEKHSFALTLDLDIDTNDMTTSLELPLQTRLVKVVLELIVKEPQYLVPVVTFLP